MLLAFGNIVGYTVYEDWIFLLTLSGIPSTEETVSSLLTVIQSSSQSQLGSQQYECPEWNSGGNSTNATSSNGQVGSVCLLCCCVTLIGNLSELKLRISRFTNVCVCGLPKSKCSWCKSAIIHLLTYLQYSHFSVCIFFSTLICHHCCFLLLFTFHYCIVLKEQKQFSISVKNS